MEVWWGACLRIRCQVSFLFLPLPNVLISPNLDWTSHLSYALINKNVWQTLISSFRQQRIALLLLLHHWPLNFCSCQNSPPPCIPVAMVFNTPAASAVIFGSFSPLLQLPSNGCVLIFFSLERNVNNADCDCSLAHGACMHDGALWWAHWLSMTRERVSFSSVMIVAAKAECRLMLSLFSFN